MKKITNLAELSLAIRKSYGAYFDFEKTYLKYPKDHAELQILGLRCRIRILHGYITAKEKGNEFTDDALSDLFKEFLKENSIAVIGEGEE